MAKSKEIIAAVFVFGEWHDVMQGTFRSIDDGSGSSALGDSVYTWLEKGSMGDRFYAKADAIQGIRTEESPAPPA